MRKFLFILFLSTSVFSSQPNTAAGSPPSVADSVSQQAQPPVSIFKFLTNDGRKEFSGTAFFISETRLLTAGHMFTHGTSHHFIRKGGRNIPARLIKLDTKLDVALIEVDEKNADHLTLLRTNPIMAIGFIADDETVSMKPGVQPVDDVFTNNIMKPGMSGCPLINAMGLVIGMGVRGNDKDKCHSVPADVLINFVESK